MRGWVTPVGSNRAPSVQKTAPGLPWWLRVKKTARLPGSLPSLGPGCRLSRLAVSLGSQGPRVNPGHRVGPGWRGGHLSFWLGLESPQNPVLTLIVRVSDFLGEGGIEHKPWTACVQKQVELRHRSGRLGGWSWVAGAPSAGDRKSTRLNSSHPNPSRMPSSA